MAVFTVKSLRLCTLALGVALAQAPPALAVCDPFSSSFTLPANTSWGIKSSGGSDRLKVDEATANICRNGALFVHTTGSNNTFVGVSAGNTATTGTGFNSGFGVSALSSITTGVNASAFGVDALRYNTTGLRNSAFGSGTLRANISGSANSAFGSLALWANTTGGANSAVGYAALRYNTTGIDNTAVGHSALYANTTGSSNSAFGARALRSNTTGYDNSAFGQDALRSNTTGIRNSVVGDYALGTNTTGNANNAFGFYALHDNTTGGFNNAIGTNALQYNTTGYSNAAVGHATLTENLSGSDNSAFGHEAMRLNTTGNRNSAFGYLALQYNTTGNRNVAVGQYAGIAQTTGSDNIYLANTGVAAESGQIRIGTDLTHTQAWMAGIYNNALASSDTVCVTSVGRLGLCASSGRFKEAVEDMGDASELLAKLRPVTFRYKKEYTDAADTRQYGLIAEEVAEVAPELVVTDAKGQPYSVRYNLLAPMLLNEAQKQQRTIERQQQVIAEISLRLALLESRPGLGAAAKGAIR